MIDLHPTQYPSTTVLEVGFDPDAKGGRGSLHVQFHDGQGKPTSRGYYRDVPRALFNALERDRKPGSIVNQQLKNRFEWVSTGDIEGFEVDPTLPDVLVIPAECPMDVESIAAYIDLQRIPVKGGLF